MDLGAWTSNDWLVVVGVLTLATYIILAIYAKRQLDEAKRLRRERTRPFVVVDFDVNWLISLVIKNIGETVAYDVQMEFSPPLQSTLSKPWGWESGGLTENGIPMLPPGKEIRYSFDGSIQLFGSDLPRQYEVTLTYADSLGQPLEKPDVYVLDLGVHEGSAPPNDGLHELVKEIRELRKDVHKVTGSSGELRVGTFDRRKEARRSDRQMRKGRRYRRRRYQPRSGLLGRWDQGRVKVHTRWRIWRSR